MSDDPRARRFDRGAALLFAVLVVFSFFALVIVAFGSSDPPWIMRAVQLVGLALAIAALLAALRGLGNQRPWARAAAVAILWLLVVDGTFRVLAGLVVSTIYIPFAAIAALVVLPRLPCLPMVRPAGERAIAALVAGAFALSVAWPVLMRAAFEPGTTPLAVAANGLEIETRVQCLPPDVAPERTGSAFRTWAFRVDVRWHWLRRDLFPDSTDGLALTWSDDVSVGYGLDPDSVQLEGDAGLWPGLGSPAAALIDPVSARGPSTTFGIDVRSHGLRDGAVSLLLRPSLPDATRGTLNARAHYAQLDRWVARSEHAACDWGPDYLTGQPG